MAEKRHGDSAAAASPRAEKIAKAKNKQRAGVGRKRQRRRYR